MADQKPITSPSSGSFQDWMDYPDLVEQMKNSFPHHGPLDKRDRRWERKIYASNNPNTKRPNEPGAPIILS